MSGTGHDHRAHTRGDSVAYNRRANGSPEKKAAPASSSSSSSRDAPGLRAAGDRLRDVTGRENGDTAAAWKQYLRLRYILPLIGLAYIAVSYAEGLYAASAVEAAIQRRRSQLGESGESHALPKRWRERMNPGQNDGGRGAAADADPLPQCKRILLFKFTNEHGFSSEMNLFVRAAVIANKLGYTLLADDTSWSFGRLQNYFLPRPIFCLPPRDWFLPSAATRLGTRRWPMQDRIYFDRDLAAHADAWLRSEVLDPDSMASLREWSKGGLLSGGEGGPVAEGETVPEGLEDIFGDMSTALKDVWRLNDGMQSRVRRLRVELGLGGGEGGLRLRKHSPTWGGAKRGGAGGDSPSSTPSVAGEDASRIETDEAATEEDEDALKGHGSGERSDRGPVVGVQMSTIRPRDNTGTVTLEHRLATVLEGVTDALARLTKSSAERGSSRLPSYSRTRRASLFPPTSRAALVLFGPNATDPSSSASTSSKLRQHQPFDLTARIKAELALDAPDRNISIERPSHPSALDLRQWNDVVRAELDHLHAPKGAPGTPKSVLGGAAWDRDAWMELPLGLRVELTKWWIRDLTTLAWFADAFVVQASSNTGKLAVLLAGEEGVIGPRQISGKGLGGRVRSVEGFWTPSSDATALWADA